jgi:cytoskeletal protein RodZ
MLSVGETLRRARQEQGLDLGAVAAQTKISAKYLQAIESDDRKVLPSGFFYKSFVEQYAKCLSLDAQEIDAEVDRLLSADEPLPLPGLENVVARNVPPITYVHRFHKRRSYKSAASLVLVLVGCSGVYAWWHDPESFVSLREMIDHIRASAKLPVARPKAVSKIVTDSAPPQRTAPERTAPERTAPESTAPESTAPVIPPQPEFAQAAAVPISVSSSTQPDPTDSAAASDYKVMLDLMAHEATWLSVSSDGKPVFSGILQANQTKSVGGKQFAKLRVGNAAGIEVRLNGKLLAPLGARGQVLIVLFTPDNFQIFSPPKESD